MEAPLLTFIVRVRDDRNALERALSSIRRQDVPVAIIVVDSGSKDGSLELAHAMADDVIEIPPEEFTFGRSLNIGAAAARTEFVAALSAHCVLPRADWARIAVTHFARPDVAAVHGTLDDSRGGVLEHPMVQSAEGPAERPNWGMSNHASAWRLAAWRDFAFDESLPTAEDKAWSRRVRAAGWVLVFDPALFVSGRHRGRFGLRALHERAANEARVLARFGIGEPLTGPQAVALWWRVPESRRPRPIERLNYGRLVEIVGWWRGGRRGIAEARADAL